MKWKLKYTNQALKFLEKTSIESIDPTIRKAIRKVIFIENTNINIRREMETEGILEEMDANIHQGHTRPALSGHAGKFCYKTFRGN